MLCVRFQEELIDPAVKGTLNVLSSCSKVSLIKRVVLTSSVTALLYNGSPLTPEVVVDESWFSDQGICKETKVHVCVYIYDRTLTGLRVQIRSCKAVYWDI